MLEYKITKVIEAGLYIKDGEKIMDLTDACIQKLTGKIVIKNDKNDKKDDE